MRAFILGAGASLHVGYPTSMNLGRSVIKWAANNPRPDHLYWIDPSQLSAIFDQPSLDDFEGIITELENPRAGSRVSTLEPSGRSSILDGFRNVLCEFFDSIRPNDSYLYRRFASEVIQAHDVVISFNYDVSLERELRRVKKWEVSDGYGFKLDIAPFVPSPIKMLKLHGSTNWIDLLFGGGTTGSSAGPGNALGERPVLLPQELEFLGYPGVTDPRFKAGGVGRIGSLILPGRQKRFHVNTSINRHEREPFWTALWAQAAAALKQADEIVAVGYGFPSADERARELVFNQSNRNSILTICCGRASTDLGSEFRRRGFTRVHTDLKRFEQWLGART